MKRKLIGILLIALMLLAFALHSIAFAETSYQVVNDQQDKALFMTPSTPQRIVDFAFRILPEIAYPIGEEGIFSLSE